MKFEITNRLSGAVQFTAEIECADDASRSVKVGLAVRWGYEQDANLRDANLQDANLQDANLRDANLQDANLQDANLRGANLQDANLRDADLRGANLRDANLQDANLRGANLQDANLRGARNISGRVIDGGLRADGYRFLLTRTEPGEWRVKAGCRDFALSDARAHWGSPDYRDRDLGYEALLIIEHMQRIAEHRSWPNADEVAS